MNIYLILSIILSLGIGGFVGFFGYKKTLTEKAKKFKEKMSRVKEIEEEIIDKAKKKSENIVNQAEHKAEKIEEQRTKKLEELQNKLLRREEVLYQKMENLEKSKEQISEKKQKLEEMEKQQMKKLEDISGLSKEDAKAHLLNAIQVEYEQDMQQFVDKMKKIKKEEADKEGNKIISRVLPRIASDSVVEFTSNMVDIPTEEFKGKLIGREGRNIAYFEKITGVELIIDDTPLVVRIASFDHEKRYKAMKTLESLIKDGRINPFYIEKVYNQILEDFDNILIEKGKETLSMLNLPMMKPEIVKIIGQFNLRFSYGQNLLNHSIEVAKISEALASELGEDTTLAKKAGLLHDVGKVIASTGQPHTKIGADFLRKYGMKGEIINSAESHHFEVPMTSTISWIVATADAMSASRPGARFNTSELFIEKMSELEKLISTVDGVNKVHIMQAGREIMVYVDPEKVTDLQLEKLLKTIGAKIEDQLDYPGIIRITAIRENKLIDFLR